MARRVLALILAMALLTSIAPSAAAAIDPSSEYILGYVIDSNGNPLPGVTILAVNSSTEESFATVSNESGLFRLLLPTGIYNISAGLANYSADRSYVSITIPVTVQMFYNFTMTEVLCTVTGYVSAGTPVFGATVTLFNSQYNYTGITVKPYGVFTISNIQPGSYFALAEKEGYNPDIDKETIDLTRGSTKERNFTLVLQAAQVYGTVTNDQDKALAGVRVELNPTDGSTGSVTTTDAYGNYTFNSLAIGNYTISFNKDSYQTSSFKVSLEPYESKRIDVSLTLSKRNNSAILFGYDLTHSLMILAFMTGLVVVMAGVYLSIRAQRKPDLLARVNEEDADNRPKE